MGDLISHRQDDEIEDLKGQIVVLKDLLESAYRKTDEARLESEKADDEALRHKSENARLKVGLLKEGYDLMWEWKRRAEKAEDALEAMKDTPDQHYSKALTNAIGDMG